MKRRYFNVFSPWRDFNSAGNWRFSAILFKKKPFCTAFSTSCAETHPRLGSKARALISMLKKKVIKLQLKKNIIRRASLYLPTKEKCLRCGVLDCWRRRSKYQQTPLHRTPATLSAAAAAKKDKANSTPVAPASSTPSSSLQLLAAGHQRLDASFDSTLSSRLDCSPDDSAGEVALFCLSISPDWLSGRAVTSLSTNRKTRVVVELLTAVETDPPLSDLTWVQFSHLWLVVRIS